MAKVIEHFGEAVPTASESADLSQYKKFIGNGSSALPVPGCKTVEAVIVGNLRLPETREEKVPTNADQTEFEDVSYPMYKLVQSESGPVLVRSVVSNDGRWQDGTPIYVLGEFEGDAIAKPKK